ncbi:hypothetical protein RvY_05322 [Ramazzottius varieornatus]|uniref:Uncharacterized protein n=1 Tax=Ramazzottius varieornatus TaxID=947166 RepID=A0A1D1UUN9_RAMVA|nr:hypothetical protein RvY_05322 [Ramazzottius varieornatus]
METPPDIITITSDSEDGGANNEDDDIIFIEDVKGTGAMPGLPEMPAKKKTGAVQSPPAQSTSSAASPSQPPSYSVPPKARKSSKKQKKKDGGEPRQDGALYGQKMVIPQNKKTNIAVNFSTLEAPGQSIPVLGTSSMNSLQQTNPQTPPKPGTYNGLFMNVNVHQLLPQQRVDALRFRIGGQQDTSGPVAAPEVDEFVDPPMSFGDSLIRVTNAAYWLLLPKSGYPTVLAGIARFKCYAGVANIAGYALTPEKDEIVVPSFSCESYLSLFGGPDDVRVEEFEKRAEGRFEQVHYLEVLNALLKFPGQISAVVLLSCTNRVSDPLLWHVVKLSPNLIPTYTAESLGTELDGSKQLFPACIVKRTGNGQGRVADGKVAALNSFSFVDHQAPLWKDIAQELSALRIVMNPVILLCGSKNVGKSTTVRFVLNSLLQYFPAVQCLDCDIGQSEFNPPGCIAMHTITAPVFGPPFARLHSPVSCTYVGSCDASSVNRIYDRAVHSVWKAGRQQSTPLVVNTMGWVEGLGRKLLMDISDLVRPNLIVDLVQEAKMRVAHELRRAPNSVCRTYTSDVKYKDVKGAFSAPQRRKLSQLMYLSRISPSLSSINDVTPYSVSLRDVTLCFSDPHIPLTHFLVVLMCSYVGLAVFEKDSVEKPEQYGGVQVLREIPICQTLGFGIVRAIDTANELCYVLTPLPLEELGKVNLLIRGTIITPEEVFLNQDLKNYEGPVPKVDARELS